MNDLHEYVLQRLEQAVQHLVDKVPLPRRVTFMDSYVYRHVEQSIQQAIVQKLARSVSVLDAAQLLCKHGLFQEQGSQQRILDEISEDITFLAHAVTSNDLTPLHKKYLEAFFEEEFDSVTGVAPEKNRDIVPRKKIRAYIARKENGTTGVTQHVAVLHVISRMYSGYIHSASPHIMDMYVGFPPKFHVRGMLGTERESSHRQDLWNYFFRGIAAFAIAANALEEYELFNSLYQLKKDFERAAGKNYDQ